MSAGAEINRRIPTRAKAFTHHGDMQGPLSYRARELNPRREASCIVHREPPSRRQRPISKQARSRSGWTSVSPRRRATDRERRTSVVTGQDELPAPTRRAADDGRHSAADISPVGILLIPRLLREAAHSTARRLPGRRARRATAEDHAHQANKNPQVEPELEDIVRKALAASGRRRCTRRPTDLQDALAQYKLLARAKVIRAT